MERNLTEKKFAGKILISEHSIDLIYKNSYQYKSENGEKYHTMEYEISAHSILLKDMTIHQRQLLKIAFLCIKQLTSDFDPNNK